MRTITSCAIGMLLGALLTTATPAGAVPAVACMAGGFAVSDPLQIRTARTLIEAGCPCDDFDGTTNKGRRQYKRCAKRIINTLVGAGALRTECGGNVRRMTTKSICGFKKTAKPVVCVREALASGSVSCGISLPSAGCKSTAGVDTEVRCGSATHCIDAADTNGDLRITASDSGRCAPKATPTPEPTPGPLATGADGKRLADLVNQYRVANGKRPLTISRTMSAVAAAHVADLNDNPGTDAGQCSPHSWSRNGGDLYTGCCYTANHAQADCMWRKPREISDGLGLNHYAGNGYEIVVRGSAGVTPEQAIEVFAGSPPHRAVMLSDDGWAFLDAHPAMGAAIRGGYAVVWFGDATDPN